MAEKAAFHFEKMPKADVPVHNSRPSAVVGPRRSIASLRLACGERLAVQGTTLDGQ
jgi:hypothetical protein